MNAKQIETLIELRANTLAEIKLNDFKRDLAQLDAYKNKVSVFHSFSKEELDGKRKQVFDIIVANPFRDRHELFAIMQETFGKASFTGMGARITELVQSGLVQVVGIKTSSETGKTVSLFGEVA